MSNVSNILGLPLMQPAQAQKHVTHNEALRILDALVQLTVVDHISGTPPIGSAQDGDCYLVGAGSGGAWAGQTGNVAVLENAVWSFIEAQEGWLAFSQSTASLLLYNGQSWEPFGSNLPDTFANLQGLGVNASPDATNRLAVSAPATLLNHEGSDHRLVLNKASLTDTASLVFQNGFSGRAEMGIAGNDNFSVRTSPDGSTLQTALELDATLAQPILPQGAQINGILQGSAILGTVGPGGQGALAETATTANGRYVRYSDGTQICTHQLDLIYDSDARLRGEWVFPVPFMVSSPVSVSFSLESEFQTAPSPVDYAFMGARHGTSPRHLGASLRIYRRSGAINFDPNDIVTVYATAVGQCF